MRATRFIVSAALLISAATSPALDVRLAYEKHPARAFRPYGYRQVQPEDSPPAGDWKWPPLKSSRPLYAMCPIGDAERLMVFDCREAGEAFYDRVYFDEDGNHDLTDDPPIEGTNHVMREHSYCYAEFPAVDTSIEVDGRNLPYRFRARASGTPIDTPATARSGRTVRRNVHVSLNAACSYLGSFALDGKKYQVALGDANCNGRFDDYARASESNASPWQETIEMTGDNLYITAGREVEYTDRQLLGHRLLVNGKLLDVSINIPQGRLVLRATKEDRFPIRLPADVEQLGVRGANDANWIMMYRPGETAEVPEDRYRLAEYRIVRADAWGDRWSLQGVATPDSPAAEAAPGTDARLSFGDPLVARVELPPWFKRMSGHRASDIPLRLRIEGCGRDFVTDLQHISGRKTQIKCSEKDKSRPAEPRVKVARQNGEVVFEGRLEYG